MEAFHTFHIKFQEGGQGGCSCFFTPVYPQVLAQGVGLMPGRTRNKCVGGCSILSLRRLVKIPSAFSVPKKMKVVQAMFLASEGYYKVN